MRFIFCLVACLAQGLFTHALAADMDEVKVMTFNIRYGTAPDGDNAWPLRKDMVFDVLRDYGPVILGLQECQRHQLDEILAEFPHYVSVGVGRDADGGGEYSPLLYDRSRFDILEAETFWLSDTPTVRGSTSWGNWLTRICTWARLVERQSNRVLRVYNTHWDHESQPSRVRSGEYMAHRIRENDNEEPLIVMGDFNVKPSNPARKPLVDIGLRDSYTALHSDQEEPGTFHAFAGKSNSGKIDAVLISDQWQVLAAEIITMNRDGRYPSDHFPVTATLKLKSE